MVSSYHNTNKNADTLTIFFHWNFDELCMLLTFLSHNFSVGHFISFYSYNRENLET